MNKNSKHKDNRSFSASDSHAQKEKEVDIKEEQTHATTASEEKVEIEDVLDSSESEIETLKNLLQQKDEEIEKEKKEYLFLMADFDNFRKRTIKEKGELIKTGTENIIKDLLPVVDDFERGLEAVKNSEDAKAIREGMELIYNKFVKVFEQNGVKSMDTNGQDFDAEQHEALTTVPGDESLKNKIIDTVTKGYTLNGKVIRHAKVVVGS